MKAKRARSNPYLHCPQIANGKRPEYENRTRCSHSQSDRHRLGRTLVPEAHIDPLEQPFSR